MNNEIQVFNNEDFGKITAVLKDGEPWFVAKNVAKILGYNQTSDMTRRVDDEDKSKIAPAFFTDANYKLNPMVRHITIINESGLYNAILGSKLPAAKKFKRWVTSEVLPAIRKTGSYQVSQTKLPNFTKPAEAARAWAEQYEAKEKALLLIEEQKPKVEFFDQVTGSEDTIDIGTAAKVLNLGIGRNELFKFLREEKILQSTNLPYQNMIDSGYFRVIETKHEDVKGEIRVRFKTVVFQKGLDYIRKRYLVRTSN